MKSLFSRYGISDCVTADGGTQCTSQLFHEFASTYDFCHRITHPHMPSANGPADRAVRTAKWILKQKDPHLELLIRLPARLLMGRDLRTRFPEFSIITEDDVLEKVRSKDMKQKKKTEESNSKTHGAISLPLLGRGTGDYVRVKTDDERNWSEAKAVVTKRLNICSYLINYKGATLRRNRRHLKFVTQAHDAKTETRQWTARS